MNKDLKNAIIVAGILVGLLIILGSLWGGMVGWQGFGGMMGGIGLGGMGIGLIFMVAFWVLIIWGIISLIRWLSASGSGGTHEFSALEILKQRYARGEINKEEFDQKKKDLGG